MRYWLEVKRKENKITQRQMAEKLGITESYYCRIERNERKKKLDSTLVQQLAKILNLSVLTIIEWEELEE